MATATVSGFRWAGMLLVFGCAVLFVGELRYLFLGPTLGLPSNPSSYGDAMKLAVSQGPNMQLAGDVSCVGDALIFAACLALARRRTMPAYADLESVSWLLLGVGFAIAIVFDSLMGNVLGPVARTQQTELFKAFKGWFDFLFAAGNIFVIGAVTIFWIDAMETRRLLPRAGDYAFAVISLLAVATGIGYIFGLPVPAQLIGGSVVVLTVGLGIFGVQIARREA